jgi:hypothetical protein
MADAIRNRVDLGASSGKLRIYSGSQPASAETAPSGTLLVEIPLPDPSFGAASNGVITLNDPGSVNVSSSGTAGWFRVLDSDNNTVFDGSVGTSGADLIVATTTFTAGVAVDIQSGGTITVPAG